MDEGLRNNIATYEKYVKLNLSYRRCAYEGGAQEYNQFKVSLR